MMTGGSPVSGNHMVKSPRLCCSSPKSGWVQLVQSPFWSTPGLYGVGFVEFLQLCITQRHPNPGRGNPNMGDRVFSALRSGKSLWLTGSHLHHRTKWAIASRALSNSHRVNHVVVLLAKNLTIWGCVTPVVHIRIATS